MAQYAVFLRGVNVGGNYKIRMSELKNVLEEKTFAEVHTYINSGNLVVKSDTDKESVRNHIQSLIKSRFDLDVDLIVKTVSELKQIINTDPFDDKKETQDSRKIMMLLSDAIDPDKLAKLKKELPLVENYYLFNDVIYIYYHNGSGRSKFSINLIERKFKVSATARNWNTLRKMSGMMEENPLNQIF
ncbi:MAG TPA: DUF1697 domain-containing protein [Bacteroidales bacterium]|jgi:uncharacterized protein (DUF1697 family)|nr:DUF1697 domain-containing protein [Bacteroidales bacterium]